MIAVTGATGFVGRAVCGALRANGESIVTIGRGAGVDLYWPIGPDFDSASLARLAGVRAVVHLAGSTIAVKWTPARKREIMESRANNTAKLARALARLEPKPSVLLSASAVGYYGNRGDEWLDESSAPGNDFLADVTRAWEDATTSASDAGIRVVRMRLGVVLGAGGGMIGQIRLPFLLGLGGVLGSGKQWMSWIALDDLTRFIVTAINDSTIAGAVNLTSPSPTTNAEFTAAFGALLHRPTIMPAPAFGLRMLFGEMADVAVLASQRVRPARLMASGYAFNHPTVEGALRAALKP